MGGYQPPYWPSTKYSVRDTITMPPHRQVRDTGYDNHVRVISVTWKEIAEQLGIA
jgi:hypothetical protein